MNARTLVDDLLEAKGGIFGKMMSSGGFGEYRSFINPKISELDKIVEHPWNELRIVLAQEGNWALTSDRYNVLHEFMAGDLVDETGSYEPDNTKSFFIVSFDKGKPELSGTETTKNVFTFKRVGKSFKDVFSSEQMRVINYLIRERRKLGFGNIAKFR